MRREDSGFLHDLLTHAEKAAGKLQGMDFDAFMANEDRKLAVTHLVMLVGECVSRVSNELKQTHAHVSWQEASAVRNRIVHASFSVDHGVIFEIARDHLPMLIQQVREILENPPAPSDGA